MAYSNGSASRVLGRVPLSAARSARQLNAVAAHELFSGDADSALKNSAEACRLGPDCWQCLHNRAAALYASGDAPAAASAESDALDRLPEGASLEIAHALRGAVSFYLGAARTDDPRGGGHRPGLIAP